MNVKQFFVKSRRLFFGEALEKKTTLSMFFLDSPLK
jgi:hypothetical protein